MATVSFTEFLPDCEFNCFFNSKCKILFLHRYISQMQLIGIKYCGGCNPLIDRPELVREIERLLHPDLRLVMDITSSPLEIGILVCGCPIACADRPDVRGVFKRWIRVGEQTVDLEFIPESKMAYVIVEKIDLLRTKR